MTVDKSFYMEEEPQHAQTLRALSKLAGLRYSTTFGCKNVWLLVVVILYGLETRRITQSQLERQGLLLAAERVMIGDDLIPIL